MDTILVVNAGSSSVKFQVFAIGEADRLERLLKGQVDGIGSAPRLKASGSQGEALIDRAFELAALPDLPAALQTAGDWLNEQLQANPVAIGHRVVHGGPLYSGPMLIDDKVLADLERYIPLAPLHQPHNLMPIRALRRRFPDVPQIACFDTAFHRGHDPL
ncbi:MAG TPA: acetate kinase, partial [Xanthobacteraceae bacterium]|nr:acetate kinase [Xanthobacteraceae bacterium]